MYDNKTQSINTNNIDIPKKYIFDYLRGYFDGDGSIFKHLQTTCKNITPCCYNITITGYIHNLKSIQNILLTYGIHTQITIDKRKYNGSVFGNLKFGSNKDRYFFLKNIYYSNGIYMNRKKELALEYIDMIENNAKYKNIIEAYAVYGQDSQKSIDD